MATVFSKRLTVTKSKIQEVQRTPRKKNTPKLTSMHVIFKLRKTKDILKILKQVGSGAVFLIGKQG